MTARDVDAVIVGGGHNGLVAAAYLGRAGLRVRLLERLPHVGGAAVSAQVFDGVDARLSRYAYLVSLLPARILDDLGATVRLAPRPYSSYTPDPATAGRTGLLVGPRSTFDAIGAHDDERAFAEFYRRCRLVTERLWPTMLRAAAHPRAGPGGGRRRRSRGGRGVAGHGRATDRRRDRRRDAQRPGARRGCDRRADRHLRPARRRVAAAERLLPVPPDRRRRRRLARPGRRHGCGERGAGRRRVRSRGRNRHRRRGLRDRSGRRGALPPRRRGARGPRPIRVGRRHTRDAGRPARRTGAGPGAGRSSQGEHGAAAATKTARRQCDARAGFRWNAACQRNLVAAGRRLFAGNRPRAAGPTSVRDLLPFAGRPQHSVARAARFRRTHVDGVRSAHAAPGVRRRA